MKWTKIHHGAGPLENSGLAWEHKSRLVGEKRNFLKTIKEHFPAKGLGLLSRLRPFLGRPYPFHYQGKTVYVLLSLIFLMTLFFNYLFEPFEVYVPEHKMPFFWICTVHALVPLAVLGSVLFVVNRIPNVDEKWTVGAELVFLSGSLLLVGISQFLVRDLIYDNPDNWSWLYFYEEIRNTFLVGSLFVAVLVPLNLNRLQRLTVQRVGQLSAPLMAEKITLGPSTVFVRTEVKGDDFILETARFLYAKAERNYVEIYLRDQKEVEKVLKRISIKNLYAQLGSVPYIFRTHRSYLVNLSQVENVTGNAQGYRISLADMQGSIPVSRNFIPLFEEKLKKI